jgi:hypothetical protein
MMRPDDLPCPEDGATVRLELRGIGDAAVAARFALAQAGEAVMQRFAFALPLDRACGAAEAIAAAVLEAQRRGLLD